MNPTDHWIWGFHSLQACLENDPQLILEIQIEENFDPQLKSALQSLVSRAGLKLKSVPRLPKVLNEKRTQGTAAKLKSFPQVRFEDFRDEYCETLRRPTQAAVLDGIQDPRNFGAILRSAAAFDLSAVFVGPRDQSPLTGVVAQASAGNLFRIKNVVARNLTDLVSFAQEQGALACALDADGENLETVIAKHPTAALLWVVGSEGKGLRSGLKKKCDRLVKIPMRSDVESLNVSTAAALAFYAAHRQFAR